MDAVLQHNEIPRYGYVPPLLSLHEGGSGTIYSPLRRTGVLLQPEKSSRRESQVLTMISL